MENNLFEAIPPEYFPVLSLNETVQARSILFGSVGQYCREQLGKWEVFPPHDIDVYTGLGSWENGNLSLIRENLVDAAKWNRTALLRYGISQGQGIFHIRHRCATDEEMLFKKTEVAELSIETVLSRDNVSWGVTQELVRTVHYMFLEISKWLYSFRSSLSLVWNKDIFMITSQHLENLFPMVSISERLKRIVSQEKLVFLEQPAKQLDSGKIMRQSAPDKDDWDKSGILFAWEPIGKRVVCLGNAGVRADAKAFLRQSKIEPKYHNLPEFHKLLISGRIPPSVGISINLSAVAMLMLRKVHPGEVFPGIWSNEEYLECEKRGIHLM